MSNGHELDKPAMYKIRIQGSLDPQWSNWFDGFVIEGQPGDETLLTGLVVVKFQYQLFFFDAIGEEVGWRGFALPRMQSFMSLLIACLILNFFWPLWHVFLWSAEGKDIFSLAYWIKIYLELLPSTVIIGWFYNCSKGSILVAGITHAAANTAFAFFPILDWTVYELTVAVAALVIILADRMWKKLPPDHLAVFQESTRMVDDQKQVAIGKSLVCSQNIESFALTLA